MPDICPQAAYGTAAGLDRSVRETEGNDRVLLSGLLFSTHNRSPSSQCGGRLPITAVLRTRGLGLAKPATAHCIRCNLPTSAALRP